MKTTMPILVALCCCVLGVVFVHALPDEGATSVPTTYAPYPPPPSTSTPSCLTQKTFTILTSFTESVRSCGLLQGLSKEDLACLTSHDPTIGFYASYACGTLNGANCTELLGELFQDQGFGCALTPDWKSCVSGVNPAESASFCSRVVVVKDLIIDLPTCVPSPSRQFTLQCSECVERYVSGLTQFFAEQPAGQYKGTGLVDQMSSLNARRQEMCGKFTTTLTDDQTKTTTTNETMCLPLVQSTVESIMRQDSLLPSFPSTAVAEELCDGVTTTTNAKVTGAAHCLRRGLVGVGNLYSELVRDKVNQMTHLKISGIADQFFSAADSICSKPSSSAGSSSCAAVLANKYKPGSALRKCGDALAAAGTAATCSQSCAETFLSELPKLGCCARSLMLRTGAMGLTTLCGKTMSDKIFAALPQECVSSLPMSSQMEELKLTLNVPYRNVTRHLSNKTHYLAMLQSDLGAILAVSPTSLSLRVAYSSTTNNTVAVIVACNTTAAIDAQLVRNALSKGVKSLPQSSYAAFAFGWTNNASEVLLGDVRVISGPGSNTNGGHDAHHGLKPIVIAGIAAGAALVAILAVVAVVVLKRRGGDGTSAEKTGLVRGEDGSDGDPSEDMNVSGRN